MCACKVNGWYQAIKSKLASNGTCSVTLDVLWTGCMGQKYNVICAICEANLLWMLLLTVITADSLIQDTTTLSQTAKSESERNNI